MEIARQKTLTINLASQKGASNYFNVLPLKSEFFSINKSGKIRVLKWFRSQILLRTTNNYIYIPMWTTILH